MRNCPRWLWRVHRFVSETDLTGKGFQAIVADGMETLPEVSGSMMGGWLSNL
jgi:hypothetical protein